MNWDETRDFLSPCFPECIRDELAMLLPGELREIRIRAERPAVFVTATRTAKLDWIPGQMQVEALTEALSGHSLFARADETRRGYLTLRGGHRMGLCGHITRKNGQSTLRDIASVCIRIAGEWRGCADGLINRFPALFPGKTPSVLIIGAPGSGKTTLLRDLTRQMADTMSVQAALIDERGELAACVDGVPQLDVGASTDVLDGLPKTEAVPWLIRSMAPNVIAMDELSGAEDAACVMDAWACGASVLATVHGTALAETANRPALSSLFSRRCFDLYVLLSSEGGGKITALHDRCGSPIPLS